MVTAEKGRPTEQGNVMIASSKGGHKNGQESGIHKLITSFGN